MLLEMGTVLLLPPGRGSWPSSCPLGTGESWLDRSHCHGGRWWLPQSAGKIYGTLRKRHWEVPPLEAHHQAGHLAGSGTANAVAMHVSQHSQILILAIMPLEKYYYYYAVCVPQVKGQWGCKLREHA